MEWRRLALELWREGKSWQDIARRVFPDMDSHQAREKVRSAVRATEAYKAAHRELDKGAAESVVYHGDGSVTKQKVIALKEGEELTPEVLLGLHGLSPDKWAVKSCTNNFYEMQKKGGRVLLLYQSKLIAEPLKPGPLTLADIRSCFDGFEGSYRPVVQPVRSEAARLMAEVNIADFHLGKYAWEEETSESYNHDVACCRFRAAVNDVVAFLEDKPVEKIVLPLGNDFFHVDTPAHTTVRGTPQDMSLRWQRMFTLGIELAVDAVVQLAQIAPVQVVYVASNHDETLGFSLACVVDAYFRGCDGVTVDLGAAPRKYVEYGSTLLGLAHGDKESRNLNSVMQVEAREAWGRTEYHEFHCAHLHKEAMTISEEGGLIVRRVSSLAGTDSWHKRSGYIGAVRKSQTFLYDYDKGLVDIHNTVVGP